MFAPIIRVYKDYSDDSLLTAANQFDINVDYDDPPYSLVNAHYISDYILNHYSRLAEIQIRNNPEVLKNGLFQTFLQKILIYKNYLIKTREDPTREFDSPSGLEAKLYASTDPTRMWTPQVGQMLKTWIETGFGPDLLDINKYRGTVPAGTALGTTPAPAPADAVNGPAMIIYMADSNEQGIKNFVADIILPTEVAWRSYEDRASVPPRDTAESRATTDKIDTDFKTKLAIINDNLKNGSYEERYTNIQNMIHDILSFLGMVSDTSKTEYNLLEAAIDIDSFYELKFEDAMINNSLIIPKDYADLLDVKTDNRKRRNMLLQMAEDQADDTLISEGLGYGSVDSPVVDLASMANSLDVSVSKLNDIKNPNLKMQKLIKTKIFREGEGDNQVQVARFLSPEEEKEIEEREAAEQNNYVGLIDTYLADFTMTGLAPYSGPYTPPDQGQTRLTRYVNKYPQRRFVGGGRNNYDDDFNDYKFKKYSTQRITVSQTGGMEIAIDDLIKNSEKAKAESAELIDEINKGHKLYKEQNDVYFESNDFVNVDNLIQRNEYLIDMMNVLQVYEFLINDASTDHQKFFDRLRELKNRFRGDVTNVWNYISGSLNPGTDSHVALNKLMATGDVTLASIQDLLKSSGLNPSKAIFGLSTPALNQSPFLGTLTAIEDKGYPVSNIGFIANDLYRIVAGRPVTADEKTQTTEELYNQMYGYYQNVKNVDINLRHAYEKLGTTANIFEQIKNNTGEIIERNIEMIIVFIQEMITVLQQFSINISQLQHLNRLIKSTKMRINEFNIYVKEAGYSFSSYKNTLKPLHNDILEGAKIKNDDIPGIDFKISDFYKTYIDDYVNNLAGSSNNFISYYKEQIDIQQTTNIENSMYMARFNVEVLHDVVKGNQLNNMRIRDNTKAIAVNTTRDLATNIFDIFVMNFTIYNIFPLYPHLRSSIIIPAIISNIYDQYCPSDIPIIRNQMGRYITFIGKKLEENATIKLSRKYKISLIINAAKAVIKYLQFTASIFTAEPFFTQITKEITNIQELINIYNLSNKDEDLEILYNYVDTVGFYKISDPGIRTTVIIRIRKYLDVELDRRLPSTATVPERDLERTRLSNEIQDEIDTMVFSIYSLYISRLNYLYNSFVNRSLINNDNSDFFNKIKEDKNQLAKLSTKNTELENFVAFNNDLATIPPSLEAIITAVGGLTTYSFFRNVQFSDAIKNNMNQVLGNVFVGIHTVPLLLDLDENKYNTGTMRAINTTTSIYEAYNNFNNGATSMLSLMKTRVNNGEAIVSLGGFTLNAFDLRQENQYLFASYYYYNNNRNNIISDSVNNELQFDQTTYKIGAVDTSVDNLLGYKLLSASNGPNTISGIFSTYGTLLAVADTTIATIIPKYNDVEIVMPVTGAYGKLKLIKRNVIKVPRVNIPVINIVAGDNIKITDVEAMIKLEITGNLLSRFVYNLIGHRAAAKKIYSESEDTNVTAITYSNVLYKDREGAKKRLLEVVRTIDYINSEIIRNERTTYGLVDVLIDRQVDPVTKKVTYEGSVRELLDVLVALSPSSPTFVTEIMKIGFIIRKLYISWYTVFAHMLSNFILFGAVENIRQFVAFSKPDAKAILADTKLETFYAAIPTHYATIKKEITGKKNKQIELRNKYPVATKYDAKVSGNMAKYMIKDNTRKIIDYNRFYTNIYEPKETHNRVFFIMALLKNSGADTSKTDNIIKQLKDIDSLTHTFYIYVTVIRATRKFNIRYPTNLAPWINKITSAYDLSRQDSIDLLRDMITPTGSREDVSTVLDIPWAASVTNDMTELVGDYTNDILSYLYDVPDTTAITIDPNRSVDNINAFTPVVFSAKPTTILGDVAGMTDDEKLTREYQTLMINFITAGTDQALRISALREFANFFITDSYRVMFKDLRDSIADCIVNINAKLNDIKIQALTPLNQLYENYVKKYPKISNLVYSAGPVYTFSITSNENADQMIFRIFTPKYYKTNKIPIDEIYNVVQKITSSVETNLQQYYEDDLSQYRRLLRTSTNLKGATRQKNIDIEKRLDKLRDIVSTVSDVMFNQHFKKFAFVNLNRLMEHTQQMVAIYTTLRGTIRSKSIDFVYKRSELTQTTTQRANYVAFQSILDKSFNGEPIDGKVYKRMSFGLIEYYYDIMTSILECLEGKYAKPFDEMSEIEHFLFLSMYIQIKRSHALFSWIKNDYVKEKQRNDKIDLEEIDKKYAENKTKAREEKRKYNNIYRYKIETAKTTGVAFIIFMEFQTLRRYLDEYSATVMDPVQLHLRINDFEASGKNKELDDLATKKGVDDISWLHETHPLDLEYDKKWDNNGLLFTNPKNGNKLKVNFPLMSKIDRFDKKRIGEPEPETKNWSQLYSDVFNLNKDANSPGIGFSRIYNTKVFPDSDIISNYMSIAANIQARKGTVLMTYGYSGTGKSASLFGKPGNAETGEPPANGILQATFDQFSAEKSTIYMRVFEIYGLGTKNNFYWNPTANFENAADKLCYPQFYQCIIEHIIDTSDPTVLKSIGQIAYTNKQDMLAYVLDFNYAASANSFTIKNRHGIGGEEVTLSEGLSYDTYFDNTGQRNINKDNSATFVTIKDEQYHNFVAFTKSIDARRKKGIKIKRVLEQTIKQIKGTRNNPDSSRSILVYDFEIKLDKSDPDSPIIPFLIYDLPGKEDMVRTYVNLEQETKFTFNDLERDDDRIKERKNTYVYNPLLAPIFDNNAVRMTNILGALYSTDGYGDKKVNMNGALMTRIVRDVLAFKIDSNLYDNDDKITGWEINGLYDPTKLAAGINTFGQLLDEDNFSADILNLTEAGEEVAITERSIVSINTINYYYYANPTERKDHIARELRIIICLVIMGQLLKQNLFDVIIEIINVCVNGPGGNDDDEREGKGIWSRSKMYAFFEAFYINENVVGLLEYLVTSVLKEHSDIKEQQTIEYSMKKDISKNFDTFVKYDNSLHNYIGEPDSIIGVDLDFKVDPELLNAEGNPFKENEIKSYLNDVGLPEDGSDTVFGKETDLNQVIYERMQRTIPFENIGTYDSNKIFRKGTGEHSKCVPHDVPDLSEHLIVNPRGSWAAGKILEPEVNRPLLQDFIEPYEKKISFYYVFYVVSNSQMLDKAEEQIKLLNNSMPFIKKMDIGDKPQCPAKKKR